MRALIPLLLAAALAQPACAAPVEREGYYITPVEMLEVYGVYRLDNGQVLRITREQRRYWAEFNREGRFEIRPVASIVFVAPAQGLRLAFTPLAFATDVRITRTAG
jgi:hypothetical protein